MATHSMILAWEILWTKRPGRLQSMGSQRVEHNLSDQHISEKATISLSVQMEGQTRFSLRFPSNKQAL